MSFPRVFEGRRYAVLGLGKAGLPAAVALRDMGAEVFVWDDVLQAPEDFVKALPSRVGGRLDGLVLSPGIPHALPKPHAEAAWALAQGVPVLTDAELLYQAVRAAGSSAKFVGITGTNGKSTTTALLAHILKAAGVPCAAGANLGPAALALPLLPDDGVYVLEMSSYMLERMMTLKFDVAALLNLSADHLDRHGDMAGYLAAKRHVFDRQDSGCVAVVGVDDEFGRATACWLDGQTARVVRISSDDIRDLKARALPGAHNAQNAAAASAMASALGLGFEAIAEGLRSYPGLPHRQEEVANVAGVRFVNDSKATNADATARAMDCYGNFAWIAGGQGKAGGIAPLAPLFSRVAKAFLIGRDGAEFAAELAAYGVAQEVVGTLERAVPAAFGFCREVGVEVILFSPAAASFDQFADFEARGQRFAALAREVG